MDSILETLLDSPKLNLYLHDLQARMKTEQQSREQFYEEMSEQRKMEFINGKVVMHSPVKIEHEFASNSLNILLSTFVRKRKLGYVGHEKMLIVLTRNDYEPDVCFWRKDISETFERGQMKFPAPNFIAEVLSPSTARDDYGVKFEDYAAHGVGEYWIIDPKNDIVEQYVLAAETETSPAKYELLKKTDSGTLTSTTLDGFIVPVRALFDEDEHLSALQRIIV
jgi:Uma2 family endonuclease